MCRSDCGQKANSPFHVLSVVAVDEGIDGTRHFDSILKASSKNLGNNVRGEDGLSVAEL